LKEFGTFILIPQTKAYKLIKKQMMTNYHESLGVTRDVFGDRMRKRLRRATDEHTKMVNQFLGKPEKDAGRKLLGKRSREEAPEYSERVAELRAEGRSESEIETIFNNEENEERDQHERHKENNLERHSTT
jgi:hypothetical protein